MYGHSFGAAVGPPKSLKERLESVGISASSVTDVIFSHAHWYTYTLLRDYFVSDLARDHQQPIHAMFPNATAWLGPGTTAHCGKGYPTIEESGMFSELLDPAKRIGKVHELSLEHDRWTTYGPFDHAYDFFGDGSVMLCNAPGHIGGNMCAIVQTSKGKACLGGDCGHHMKLVDHVCDIGQWKKEDGSLTSMHVSIDGARKTLGKLKQLKAEGVKILLAHDPHAEWDDVIA